MKFVSILLLLCILSGCALAPDSYASVTPHTDPQTQETSSDAVTAENYRDLKAAILHFVELGQTDGAIRVTNYDGDVESDLSEAVYEVVRLDPLGAYAVDYMTHDCTLIVNYYEIRIHTTFRRTPQEIAGIEPVISLTRLIQRLQKAVDDKETRITLRVPGYREPDLQSYVDEYCQENPGTVIETPTVSFSVYPDSGNVRIMEVNFKWVNQPKALLEMEQAVEESIDAAAEYIRYRQSDRDKVELLFTYLMERFQYTPALRSTTTPLYDALCGGIANNQGLAQAWQLICDRAGIECRTVSGMLDGRTYTWNIVSDDGYYRHLDLTRCVLEDGALVLRDDTEMTEYYWNYDWYPTCDPRPEETPDETPPQEQPPAEETPEEEQPAPSEETPNTEP